MIYNPQTNLCRNKSGDNTWQEDAPDLNAYEKIAKISGVKPKSD